MSFLHQFLYTRFDKNNTMAKTIKRSEVLKLWDIKEDHKHNAVIFSVKFDKKNGERVFLPRAISCGLKASLKDNRMRAAQPVDNNGVKDGHPYPICIDHIIEFNGRRVSL